MERKLDINKFLGIYSDDAGSTDLPIGALSQMQNFQVLPSYKLRKRSGYSPILTKPFFKITGEPITIPAGRMPGDTNGDGKFTQADHDIFLTYYMQTVSSEDPLEKRVCDINGDGQITINDLNIMMSLLKNPYTNTSKFKDFLGVWGTKYDLEQTTNDWLYYVDIPVAGMTEGGVISIALEGSNVHGESDIGLYKHAECLDGAIRVFSKLLPNTARTAYYSTTDPIQRLPIRGQWYGKLNNKYYHIVAVGGKAYIIEDGTIIELGDLADAPTNIFQFGENIYFQDGTNYKKFTGKQIINETEVNFDSKEEDNEYPKTFNLPAGEYRIQLGGGKGRPDPLGSGTIDFGGKGGTIHFIFTIEDESEVEIRKITNNGEYGASFWLLINGQVCAAVGGGGGGSWYNGSGGSYYNKSKGGDGGGDVGEDGTQNISEDGKGANLCQGGAKGTINKPSSTYKITSQAEGENGYNCDHPEKAGQGGLGGHSVNIGGCGYAGGGGGSSIMYEKKADSSWWVDRTGAGAGGSSFVNSADKNLTLLENSRGTNNAAAYIKINTIRGYFSLEDAGYAPLVYAGTKPDGSGGTAIEPINNLSSRRRQQFNGDDSSTVYRLTEKNNYSVYEVYVNGELQRLTDEYTLNGTNDEVTFVTKPSTGTNNVEIRYMKSEFAEGTEEISKHTHSRVYGGKNDNRIFLYGNGNRLVYSDLADGIPSAEYFPVTNTLDIGTAQHDITGLTVQYDRMLIHKERGTWWTHYDYSEDLLMANFPTYPLNDNIGQSYKGVERVCENNPYVLQDKQLWEFVASNVRDERNVKVLSENVQTLLDELDFSNVRTLDYEKYGEYWIINGRRIYIYNYRIGVWFYYYLAHEVTSAIVMDERICLGTTSGELFLMDNSVDDDGELINAFIETGWIDYRLPYTRKFLNFMWVQIFPESDTSAEVHFQVDRGSPRFVKRISYKNIDFDDVDFSDFTFLTNYNPKSFRLKPKAKKFVYIKFTVINNERNKLTLLGLSAPVIAGGLSK